jgi:molybdopterin/thiamine biosynthesis adenylyltransferase/proteasome lid subunit RPN8/RPN11
VTRYTLTILEEHRAALQASVLRDDREYGALLLCGRSEHVDPWTGEKEERFLARELIDVQERAFVERTPFKMTWSTAPFYHALKRAEPKGFAIAAIHSHPRGPLAFSTYDDVADRELFQIAFDRLDSERPHLALVMDRQGDLIARAYERDLNPHGVDLVRVIGDRWRFQYPGRGTHHADPEFDRQVRAFGAASTEDLGWLRIGVVGCGGTGSAVASLLARIGVRRLALFDPDRVDETSLNRLHFSRRTDANLGRHKVDVVGEGIAEIGLSTSIVRLPHYVDDPECRDTLRSCDMVFGCTDDHLGRNLLNRLAHFYLIPIIDLGVLIEPKVEGGYDAFDGRVTVVQPGYPCQGCRGLVQSERMKAEGLRRHDPLLYRERRRAGYVVDAPDPSPVVVSFTTELAAVAVNELFQRLNGFRGPDGQAGERVRRFDEMKDSDTLPGGSRKPGCPVCQVRRYDGRGDMTPFLDQA